MTSRSLITWLPAILTFPRAACPPTAVRTLVGAERAATPLACERPRERKAAKAEREYAGESDDQQVRREMRPAARDQRFTKRVDRPCEWVRRRDRLDPMRE